MIYVTADLHFGHNQPFLYGPRGFNSIEEHDETIIALWNDFIKPTDTVYILGDCIMNDNESGIDKMLRLNGQLFIVLGNHDSLARKHLYDIYFDTLGYAIPITYKHYNFFLSHYPSLVSNYDSDKPLKSRVINLCGHCHTNDPYHDWDKGLIYHCELDAHFNMPVSLDEIIQHVKEKINEN